MDLCKPEQKSQVVKLGSVFDLILLNNVFNVGKNTERSSICT